MVATIRTGESTPDAVTALWKDGLLPRLELQPLSRDETRVLLHCVLDGPVLTAAPTGCGNSAVGTSCSCGTLSRTNSGQAVFHVSAANGVGLERHRRHRHLSSSSNSRSARCPRTSKRSWTSVAIAEPIDRQILAGLAEPESIEFAERRGLIAAALTGNGISVGHPLYGEIRLENCGPLRLKRLRGRVAEAMADTPELTCFGSACCGRSPTSPLT